MNRGGITPRERDAIVGAFKAGHDLDQVAGQFPRGRATLKRLRTIANRECEPCGGSGVEPIAGGARTCVTCFAPDLQGVHA